GSGSAGVDGGRPASDPGGAEAYRSGGGADRAGGFLQVPPAFEPHPVRPVAHFGGDYGRGNYRSGGEDAGGGGRAAHYYPQRFAKRGEVVTACVRWSGQLVTLKGGNYGHCEETTGRRRCDSGLYGR